MRSKCPAPTSNMQQPALPTCPSGLIITRDNVASLIDIVIYVSRKRVPFLDTDVKGAVRVSMGHPRKFCESWRKVGEIFIARRNIFSFFLFLFRAEILNFVGRRERFESAGASASYRRRYGRSVTLCKERGIDSRVALWQRPCSPISA